ncbi:MAG: helix-turn-helix domain-containing protein [Ruminococcus sp.]|uniref:helix-turn-helix domain-containing protein n=1 Tax=Ruminococcus sp. TaxID=41978 RepID=UPI0025D75A09|nr:helix-turn-helix transcriptional regulator [Ruminococcus sp.]MCR4794223.1 helix-turn-helix domain-containing protein [Ruminococcus sp.]
MSIDYNLKVLRTKMQLSQKEMAQKLDMNYRTYASYERGEREPGAAIIKKICITFGISSDELLNDSVPTQEITRPSVPSDDEIKFALFDGSEGVTDEMYDEVKRFAKYIKEQKEKK